MQKINLPKRIFFTGVPGSRWSSIAQTLESLPGFNISDRTYERNYNHHEFTGHKGAYFGLGMELEAKLNSTYIDNAWTVPEGTKIVKSHDWAYKLATIKLVFPDDWIMLVYRPDLISYAWWHEAGGFKIKYPNYQAYKDSVHMLTEIQNQNKHILEFAYSHNATWNYFTTSWIEENFSENCNVTVPNTDILVTIIK